MTMSLTIGARLGPRWTRVVALLVSGLCALASSSAGQPAEDAPWFGVAMPPAFEPHVPPVIVGERGVAPAVVPPGEDAFTALTGGALQVHLASIVQFSRTSREKREIGSGQLWGRITGFPSGHDTVSWAAGRFEEAGIDDVWRQPFDQEPGAEFWLPLSWEMRLLGDPAFGAGTEDLVLTTAMPLAPSAVPPEGLEAPLVHAGFGTVAELTQIDVRGKVAVLHVTPQGHLVFERGAAVPRARALFERGALGVINVIDLPGNERARDFSNCGGPCFNLGGRDGRFLETVMDRAADAGVLDRLRVRFALETTRRSGLSAHNAIAVIPGSERPDETIIINAHADAWFDGADDNGDGLAVLVGLARHFATEADPPPAHTRLRGQCRSPLTGDERAAQFRRHEPGLRRLVGTRAEHRACRAAESVASAQRCRRRVSRVRGRCGRGADRGRGVERGAVPGGPLPTRCGALRYQFRVPVRRRWPAAKAAAIAASVWRSSPLCRRRRSTTPVARWPR